MARTAVWATALGTLAFAASYLLGASTDEPAPPAAATHAASSVESVEPDVAGHPP